jgi:hypothetical protein
LKIYFDPSELLTVSLLAKCKNLRISSDFSHVLMSPNPGVEVSPFVIKYGPRIGLWIMTMSMNRPNITQISPSVTCFHALADDLFVSLTVVSISFLMSNYKSDKLGSDSLILSHFVSTTQLTASCLYLPWSVYALRI